MKEAIQNMIDSGKFPEAILELEKITVEQRSAYELLVLGELYYKAGRTIDALNQFNAVLRLEPANKKAMTYVTMINDVLNFYHKDLLNP